MMLYGYGWQTNSLRHQSYCSGTAFYVLYDYCDVTVYLDY